ncbi:hypothetical protein ABZ478_32635 [Streptomyces sp. NPDC005706]|uniref:hypothetical protein n=1 Tax=Streptomyces sp. NPDC005706 TaxID=3157169 RepID=UPI0033FAA41C
MRIEHQYKRSVVITADLARCVLLASVPVAMAFGRLTYTQLCVVGVLQTRRLSRSTRRVARI